MAANLTSKVLSTDSLILNVVEDIDATNNYFTLGRELDFKQSTLSDIIGKTKVDFEEAVYQFVYRWRNAHGVHEGEKLINIFGDLKLEAAKLRLQKEVELNEDCLGNDRFLQTLVSEINCVENYQKLGLALVGNEAKVSNIVGLARPQYEKALYRLFIKWRDAEGSSLEVYEKLKKILKKNELGNIAERMNELEYGSDKSKKETSLCSPPTPPSSSPSTPMEEEAKLVCSPRTGPEGDSLSANLRIPNDEEEIWV